MSGYTPVFNTIFTGTLCGKYPDTAAWLYLLALADKNGVVDMTPQYISSVTGMPLDDLISCIERFMEPDPHSRSLDHEGRRLIPLDPDRPWGWKIVNHSKYKDKARKMSYDGKRTESGQDAERKRESRRVPTCPDGSRDVPPSNTDTNTNTEREGKPPRKRGSRLTEDWHAGPELVAWAREKRPDLDVEEEVEKFRDYYLALSGPKGVKLDWPRTFKNWIRNAREGKQSQGGDPFEGAS